MKEQNSPVRFIKVSDKEDAVVISFKPEKKFCRKCKEELIGGEVDYGICDWCENN